MIKRESNDPQGLDSFSPSSSSSDSAQANSDASGGMTPETAQKSSVSTDLTEFGFDRRRQAAFDQARAEGGVPADAIPARLIFESRERYRVITPQGELEATVAGRLRLGDSLPAVGDWLAVDSVSSNGCRICRVFPRRTRLSRKVAGAQVQEQLVAANVDTVFLVMGLDGDFNLRRLERFTVMAADSGAEPVVVLTKADLHADPAMARLDAQQVAPGTPVYVVSSLTHQGLEPLRAFLEPGRTVALIGSSGAGKSTLLNRLNGSQVMRTGEVRESDQRGRHTTTHRQLVQLASGGLLVDNPGVREIQLWAEGDSLGEAFDDVERWASECRFNDCRHGDEPGCAVRAAVAEGRLDGERLRHWQELAKELAHLERRRDVVAQRREGKRLGRMYKRVQAEKKNRFR